MGRNEHYQSDFGHVQEQQLSAQNDLSVLHQRPGRRRRCRHHQAAVPAHDQGPVDRSGRERALQRRQNAPEAVALPGPGRDRRAREADPGKTEHGHRRGRQVFRLGGDGWNCCRLKSSRKVLYALLSKEGRK